MIIFSLCVQSLILYYIKQIDSMLPWICPVIDHRWRQSVIRTTVTHSAIASCATFLFLPHFDVICDLLLDRCTATWNLFEMKPPQVGRCPRYAGGIWKSSFISTVTPTVQANPSRKRSFLKTLFKLDKYESVGFSCSCGLNWTFWKGSFPRNIVAFFDVWTETICYAFLRFQILRPF